MKPESLSLRAQSHFVVKQLGTPGSAAESSTATAGALRNFLFGVGFPLLNEVGSEEDVLARDAPQEDS